MMRLASLKSNQLAVVKDDSFVPISASMAEEGWLPEDATMAELIANYDALLTSIAKAAERGTPVAADQKQLLPPVPKPSKIWAAASNYKRGGTGIDSATGRGAATTV